jgi:acyl-CoA thioester hydrolase
MERSEIGRPTYHTRVERWECDYNDHWNVRFYGRSFQAASETIAAHEGRPNPGANTVKSRLMRFHSELRVSAPVEVRSAKLTGADNLDGAVIHHMWSAGKLAATGLDLPGTSGGHLPPVTPEDVPMALPRGITGPPPGVSPAPGVDLTEIELGPIRREDLDHTGQLRFDTLLRHSSNIQHAQLNKLGLTPDYADKNRINRMGVEFRLTRGATPAEGECLRGRTWISRISGKAFWATTAITAANDDLVALIEMCVVTVNLDTRKAVPVPDFMYGALGSVGN